MDFNSTEALDSEMHTKVISNREWSPRQTKFFLRRAKGHAKLYHPHILRLVDVQAQGDEIRLFSELAKPHLGQRWEKLDRDRFIRELLGVLHFAHKNGIVHGCLCPKNLRFDRNGGLKVWGFGFDWYERGSHVLDDSFVPDESFHYVSPESLRGEKKDGRADFYSFGLLLYRCWGKELNFQHSTRIDERVSELLRGPKLSLEGLPKPVASTIEACLRLDPTERPSCVADVMAGLGVEREESLDSMGAQQACASEIFETDHWEGAREALLHALEINPKSAAVLNDLGAAALWTGHISEAQSFLRRACELEPMEEKCHFNLGLTYLRLGDLDDAALAFQKTIALNEKFGRAHLELSRVLRKLGQTRKAIESAQKAASLLPNVRNAYSLLAELWSALDDQLALRHFSKAREFDEISDNPETLSTPA